MSKENDLKKGSKQSKESNDGGKINGIVRDNITGSAGSAGSVGTVGSVSNVGSAGIASKKDVEKRLQRCYLELQILDARAKQAQRQIQQVDAQALELLKVAEGLSELSSASGKKEVLVPFSAGIFLKAELGLPDEIFVSVGSNVVVKKSISDTRELIESQIGELERIKVQLSEELNSAVLSAHSVEKELLSLSQQVNINDN